MTNDWIWWKTEQKTRYGPGGKNEREINGDANIHMTLFGCAFCHQVVLCKTKYGSGSKEEMTQVSGGQKEKMGSVELQCIFLYADLRDSVIHLMACRKYAVWMIEILIIKKHFNFVICSGVKKPNSGLRRTFGILRFTQSKCTKGQPSHCQLANCRIKTTFKYNFFNNTK